jgi:hypothetical protein
VALSEALIGKGIDLRIYDPNLVLENLVWANKIFIEEQIPHIGRLLYNSFDELIARNEFIILGNRYDGLRLNEKVASMNGPCACWIWRGSSNPERCLRRTAVFAGKLLPPIP